MSAKAHFVIKRLGDVLALTDSLKKAEKAKIPTIKSRANDQFTACYADFTEFSAKVMNYNPLDSLPATIKHPQLTVMVAQAALYTENYDIAKEVLALYFQTDQQLDQFYCDAKIVKALLVKYDSRNMNGTESMNFHKLAVAELMEALEISLSPKHNLSRYKFLVFNISTAFYKIVHPFLRTGRAKFFAPEMTKVVNAVEAQDDPDLDWRVMLLSAAAVCMDDDKQAKPAVDYIDKAILHMENLLTKTKTRETKLVTESDKANKEAVEVMTAFRAIEDREMQLLKPRKIDPDEVKRQTSITYNMHLTRIFKNQDPEVALEPYDPGANLPPLEGLAAEGIDRVNELLDESQLVKSEADEKLKINNEIKRGLQETLNRLYRQRVYTAPADSKRWVHLSYMPPSLPPSLSLSLTIASYMWEIPYPLLFPYSPIHPSDSSLCPK